MNLTRLLAACLVTGLALACAPSPEEKDTFPVFLDEVMAALSEPADAPVPTCQPGDEAAYNLDCASEEAVARRFLTAPRRAADVWDVTASYPWLTVGRTYWVLDRSADRRLFVATLAREEPPLQLTDNPAGVAELLTRQFAGRFPGTGHEAIPRILKDSFVGRSSVIATPEFLEKQREDLYWWLRGREKDPAVFESFCAGVSGEQRGNDWQVQFNVFNARGGVDVVRASGTREPLTIRDVVVEVLKTDGEFSFPLVG